MVARTQINRSQTNGYRPPNDSRLSGELFVNTSDLQLCVMDRGNDPIDLLPIRIWMATGIYHAGDFVWHAGDILQCLAATATHPTFTPSEWSALTSLQDVTDIAVGATEGLKEYSPLATYALNALVTYQGFIYRNTTAILVPEAWNPAHWLNIVPPPLPEPIPAYSATDSYAINDLMTQNGKIYRAKVPVPPGGFVSTMWDVIAGDPLAALPDGGPTNEPPQDGNYYVRQNHIWVRTALWEFAGSDVLLKISGTGVIRITPAGLLEVKGDVEVFSTAV